MQVSFEQPIEGRPAVHRVDGQEEREFCFSFGRLNVHMGRRDARRILEKLASEFAQLKSRGVDDDD